MRAGISVALAIVLGFLAEAGATVSALAEARIALLIGNQSYAPEIGMLVNPRNDIALLGRTLKSLNFDVTTVSDAGMATLHQAVNVYARRLREAGPNAIGFFYYSGHGAQDAGVNYLIPVDVKSAEDSELWDRSLRLTEVTRKLKNEAGNATHFVVVDACRNELKLKKSGTRALMQSKGFVPVGQESGMLIAYATAEGELASDVGAGAGPYAIVLAQEIVKPGIEAVSMFRNVQIQVKRTIGQDPWLSFPSLPPVYLAGLNAEPLNSTATPQGQPQISEAERAWASVKDTTNQAVLEVFAKQFAETVYGALARARVQELKRIAAIPAAPPKVIAAPSLASPSAPQTESCLNPNALGVTRTVIIDASGGPRFGTEQYKEHDFLLPKEVVLTFDDGPWPVNTRTILAALAQHCTKATFFPIGKHALWHPEILKEVAAAGHTIGSHTWSHANLGKLKEDMVIAEIEKGISAVKLALGASPAPFFRFPYLLDPNVALTYLGTRHIAIISHDLDSFDFKMHIAEDIIKSVMIKLERKGKGIILMHDFTQATAKASLDLLNGLKAKGYKVVHMKADKPLTTLAPWDDAVKEDFKVAQPSQSTSTVVRTERQ